MTTLDPVRKLPSRDSGWSGLFWSAFRGSRNAMVLLDERRCQVEANGAYLKLLGYPRSALIGHPVSEVVVSGEVSEREWRAALRRRQFTGVTELKCDDGRRVRVEFAGHPELVTGRHLVLMVAVRSARGIRRLDPDPGEDPPGGPDRLSSREREVVGLVAAGLSGPEIAQELHVSSNTVRTHVRNAMQKLGAHSRAQLVAMVLAEGRIWDAT
jgi:PAS domain S-box-containing protein